MLILFPFGLWVVSLLCDLLYLAGGEPGLWLPLALYSMAGGLTMALALAVQKAGARASTINLIVMALYGVNLWLRSGEASHMGIAIALSAIGVGALALSSWFTGKKIGLRHEA
jgi:uncharacterized membrane protein